MFEIRDKETRLAHRDKDIAAIPPAEEIMITKAEIDQLNETIHDINTKSREYSAAAQKKYTQAMKEKDKIIEAMEQ